MAIHFISFHQTIRTSIRQCKPPPILQLHLIFKIEKNKNNTSTTIKKWKKKTEILIRSYVYLRFVRNDILIDYNVRDFKCRSLASVGGGTTYFDVFLIFHSVSVVYNNKITKYE